MHVMPAKESTFDALIDAYGPVLAHLCERENNPPCTTRELIAAVLRARNYVHLGSGWKACDEVRWNAATEAFTVVLRDLEAAFELGDPKDVQLLLWRAEQHLRVGIALVTADF